MKPRLYLETTIPSYLTSRPSRDLIIAGHQQITQDWWQSRRADFQLYVSQLVRGRGVYISYVLDTDAVARRDTEGATDTLTSFSWTRWSAAGAEWTHVLFPHCGGGSGMRLRHRFLAPMMQGRALF
jgi:hypothetical protein